MNTNPKQQEKLKCIKHKLSGEVLRVTVSEAEHYIAEDENWHYTSKGCYKQTLKNEGRVHYTAGEYMTGHTKKRKPYHGHKITQVIEKTIENPNYDPKPILAKPRKAITPRFKETYKNPATTVLIKAPDHSRISIKVVGMRNADHFIKKVERVVHIIAFGEKHPKFKNSK